MIYLGPFPPSVPLNPRICQQICQWRSIVDALDRSLMGDTSAPPPSARCGGYQHRAGTTTLGPRAFEFDAIAPVGVTRSEQDAFFSTQTECLLSNRLMRTCGSETRSSLPSTCCALLSLVTNRRSGIPSVALSAESHPRCPPSRPTSAEPPTCSSEYRAITLRLASAPATPQRAFS
jgi:hypothetical protein